MENFETIVIEQLANISNKFDKRFDALEKRMDALEKRMDAIEERMDNLEKQFNEFHEDILERIDNLHGSVVILENKVMSEFPALFETFELNKKLQDDRNEKVAYLSKKTEEHSIRISALEGKMKAI